MSQPRKTMKKSEQIMLGLFSSNIPEEIVEEILLRLPVQSLLRFKCVSKPWYSLLSSKMFVKNHLENSAKNNLTFANARFIKDSDQPNHVYCRLNLCSLDSLFHETDDTEPVVHDLDDPLAFHSFVKTNVVGYANGLCCIREDEKEFILWNPATKKSRKLPPVYGEEFLWWIHDYGEFEFVQSSNDYKVLAVVRTRPPGVRYCSVKLIFRVYSLRTNSWKTVEDFLVNGQGSGVLVDGKLHWASRVRNDDSVFRLNIVSFDLGSEAVGSVEQPRSIEGYHLCPALSVLDGCLAVRCRNKKDGTDIWVMKEYGVTESWCKLMTVATIGDPYQTFSSLNPLYISPEGEILLYKGSSPLIYNPKKNSFRPPRIDITLTHYKDVGFYCESLVSPFPDDE